MILPLSDLKVLLIIDYLVRGFCRVGVSAVVTGTEVREFGFALDFELDCSAVALAVVGFRHGDCVRGTRAVKRTQC